MYPTASNNAYYFAAGDELEIESTSQPCPVVPSLVYDPWQNERPFPASYDCWETSTSFGTSSWLDAPVISSWLDAQPQPQHGPVSSALPISDMQQTLNDLPLMDLPGPEELASTPNATLGSVEPSSGVGGWCDQVTMPTVQVDAISAQSRTESAVFSLDEPTAVPGHKKVNKKRAKGTPDELTTSPGPPVTIALPKPTGDPERDAFLARVYTTNAHVGKPIQKLPVVGKIPLDLFALHGQVAAHGGFEKVLKDKMWKPIAINLGISLKACTDYGFRLRRHYERFLTCIDAADRAGGTTTPPPPGGKRSVLGTKKRVGGGGIVKRPAKRPVGVAVKTAAAKPVVRR